jgi:ParB family transcriptional regulator, chromosome partitioning protein
MSDVTSIPLNKLVAWDGNVRKTAGADTSLHELASSIAAHGLINNLVVKPHRKDSFTVMAGGRRLTALQLLAKGGRLPADHPVKCEILGDKANALELSLAESAVREQMHPADEFDAFRALVDDGMPTTDIAARFGVTEKTLSCSA